MDFFPVFYQTLAPRLGHVAFNEIIENAAIQKLDKICAIIEQTLGQHPFLAGKSFTVADIYFLTFFHFLFRYVLDSKFRNKYP
jgi:glutathione S-transferase